MGVVILAGAAIYVVMINRLKQEVVFHVQIFLCSATDMTGFIPHSNGIFFYKVSALLSVL
jgi:hypothetical protein